MIQSIPQLWILQPKKNRLVLSPMQTKKVEKKMEYNLILHDTKQTGNKERNQLHLGIQTIPQSRKKITSIIYCYVDDHEPVLPRQ
jgi:hypothetical protein